MSKRHESAFTLIAFLLGLLFVFAGVGQCAMRSEMPDSATTGGAVVSWIVAAFFFALWYGAGRPTKFASAACPACGTVGQPDDVLRGSGGIEFLLYLVMIAPGLIYSAWRRSGDRRRCPGCGAAGVVPLDTPRGRELAARAGMSP